LLLLLRAIAQDIMRAEVGMRNRIIRFSSSTERLREHLSTLYF
jgi:hypothetical protein